MELAEVKDRLEIDETNLDHELVLQPVLVDEVNDAWADALSARDDAKIREKELRTEAASRYREELDKPTEKAIVEAVDKDEEVAEATRKHNELCDLARRWEKKHESVKARGYALHKLCDMRITFSGAVSGQSESGRVRRERADEEVQEAVRGRRRRRAV